MFLSFFHRSGLSYTHLVSPMPSYFKKYRWKPKGVSGRRAALSWLKHHLLNSPSDGSGVVYFGDDDNSFDLQLFPELRKTRTVSMFPVGLIGDFGISSPIVKQGKIVGFVLNMLNFFVPVLPNSSRYFPFTVPSANPQFCHGESSSCSI